MKKLVKSIGLFAARAILSLCALAIMAVLLFQIALIVIINLVSTGHGSAFFQDRINAALADSGYQVAFTALYYDPVRGLVLHDLAVADTDGPFLRLDRFSLAVAFSQMALRDLHLSGHGGTLTLLRPPASAAQADDAPRNLEPFTVPSLYFKAVSIRDLSFQSVILDESVTGQPLNFSPSLQSRIVLNDTIGLALQLRPGLAALAPNVPGPDKIELQAALTPGTLDLSLHKFSVTAPVYKLEAEGAGNFHGDGHLDFTIAADYADLGPLTQNNLQKAVATLALKGPYRGPAIDLTGTITPDLLRARGLAPVDFTLSTADIAQGMRGAVQIATRFKDQPVTVAAHLSYDREILTVTDLEGMAPHITLNGQGTYSDRLINGDLTLAVADLAPYSDLLGTPVAGKLDAAVQLKPAGAAQSAQIDATLANAAYNGMTARSLTVRAALADLGTPWPQAAQLNGTHIRLHDDVTLQNIAATITAAAGADDRYTLALTGDGGLPAPVSFSGSAVLSGLTGDMPAARDIALTVQSGASAIALTGDFTPDTIALTLAAKDMRMGDMPAALPPALADARLTAAMKMTGSPAAPQTAIDAALTGIDTGDYPDLAFSLTARHDGAAAAATLTGSGTGIRRLHADIAFPFAFALYPFHMADPGAAALNGTIAADIDLAALSPLFLPPAQSLSGALAMTGDIGGTIAVPAPRGAVRLSDAAFRDDANGIVIADLAAEAAFTHNSLTVSALSATDGRSGTLSGGGTVARDGGTAANVDITMRGFNIPQTDLANGVIDAALSLRNVPGGLHFAGTVDVEEMNILIPETFQSRIPELNIVERTEEKPAPLAGKLTLAVAIDAPNRIFVRGWGLDAEFGGNIEISGDLAAPQFHGTLSSQRGRFEEFGKRFTLSRAHLRFQGDVPPSPYLDVEATIPAGDVTAAIVLSGPVGNPALAFTSLPALPEDEVLSRILFGKGAATISPFQAIQLAQTIQRFSGHGGGGLDPLGLLRSATGLDDITFEADESGSAQVGVGKYLTDKVYLELESGNAESAGAATIQIEVSPGINVESRMGQDAQAGGGLFWKRDY